MRMAFNSGKKLQTNHLSTAVGEPTAAIALAIVMDHARALPQEQPAYTVTATTAPMFVTIAPASVMVVLVFVTDSTRMLAQEELFCNGNAAVTHMSIAVKEIKGLAGRRQRRAFGQPKMHHDTLFERIKIHRNVL